ncbi:unnamed protein product [Hyaloperonospora brassicae]|uniref:tRNA-binding domain-containing protein n=1 Tax=Hyaloperonospora brassicae TaxID=162125 RepID=A0AAV0TQC9_HYABA|nr:unnamed protein product [Hyaloperonospora brassicae]
MLRSLSFRFAVAVRRRQVRRHFAAPLSAATSAGDEATAVFENKQQQQQQQQQQQPLALETTWDKLVIGEIVAFHPHPRAGRLSVCSVNIGDANDLLTIVCGATNIREGARVPVATVGTRLVVREPETGELRTLKIKKAKFRGEVSQGMICSEAELGLADQSDGVLVFDTSDAAAVVGSLVCEHAALTGRVGAAQTLPRQVTTTTTTPTTTATALRSEAIETSSGSEAVAVLPARCTR